MDKKGDVEERTASRARQSGREAETAKQTGRKRDREREERERERERYGQAEEKPPSARKSCSLEREFLENREKLVIKARERRAKKRRKTERKREETRQRARGRVGAGDESCRVGGRRWKHGVARLKRNAGTGEARGE